MNGTLEKDTKKISFEVSLKGLYNFERNYISMKVDFRET